MSLKKTLARKLNLISIYSKLVSLLFGFLLDNREKKLIAQIRSSNDRPPYNPVFIIGAPRSGSTLFYQLLINELDVLYISNFTHVFHKWLNVGFRLEKHFLKKKNQYALSSNYGDTLKSGWGGPSECGDFWYNKISRSSHLLTEEDVTQDALNYFKDSIEGPILHDGKPLLFKNMHAGQRINYIRKIIPEAKFIFITRDFNSMVQSIAKARLDIEGDKNIWWSIKPKEFETLKDADYLTQIVGQVFYIESQIATDLENVAAENKMVVSYEKLCEDPEAVMSKAADFIFNSPQHFQLKKKLNLAKQSKNRFSETELRKIEQLKNTFESKV